MHNARFRLLSGLAGATLFLFAATSNGQTPNTPTTTGSAQTTPQTGTATDATTPTTTDAASTNATVTRTTSTDVSTTTSSFPGGLLGILAVAVLVLLVLFALFRGKDRTVVRETYASSSTAAPAPRNVSSGPATDDRMNLNSRAASGPGDTGGGANDPNARR